MTASELLGPAELPGLAQVRRDGRRAPGLVLALVLQVDHEHVADGRRVRVCGLCGRAVPTEQRGAVRSGGLVKSSTSAMLRAAESRGVSGASPHGGK
jgi:hypothetical protein